VRSTTKRVHTAVIGVAAIVLGAGSAACARASASDHARVVAVTIRFSRFSPAHVDVAPGETIRFVVTNADPIAHEFIVGNELVQQIHEAGTEAHHPPRPGEISVPAGTTRSTEYTFPTGTGALLFGCHLPGHYAYGMKGSIAFG
jgi:uncharacterized cupredoxin-like copper-binding protein